MVKIKIKPAMNNPSGTRPKSPDPKKSTGTPGSFIPKRARKKGIIGKMVEIISDDIYRKVHGEQPDTEELWNDWRGL